MTKPMSKADKKLEDQLVADWELCGELYVIVRSGTQWSKVRHLSGTNRCSYRLALKGSTYMVSCFMSPRFKRRRAVVRAAIRYDRYHGNQMVAWRSSEP